MADDDETAAAAAKAERKRKRLEAWRKRQQQQEAEKAELKRNGGFTKSAPITQVPLPPSASTGGTTASIIGEEVKHNKPKVKIGLGLSNIKGRKKRKKNIKRPPPSAGFALVEEKKIDNDIEEEEDEAAGRSRAGLLGVDELNNNNIGTTIQQSPTQQQGGGGEADGQPPKKRRRGRWDMKQNDNDEQSATSATENDNIAIDTSNNSTTTDDTKVNDELDAFMMRLEAGDAGDEDVGGISTVVDDQKKKEEDAIQQQSTFIDSTGSMVRMARTSIKGTKTAINNFSNTTAQSMSVKTAAASSTTTNNYTFSDWESDAPATPYNQGMNYETEQEETDDEEEEKARRAFIEALKKTSAPLSSLDNNQDPASVTNNEEDYDNDDDMYETKSEVKSEKERREDAVKQLSLEAERLRKQNNVAIDTGRIYNDDEGGIMEEAERNLAALTAAPDALEVLAEMNKKKELRAVDHNAIDYLPVRKNLYIVPQSLARLSPNEVAERRAKLGVKVRGKGAPAPVSKFSEAGLSERIMSLLEKKGIVTPFPVQAQCIPCIMAGRDVIGIAKTGSGKTLAFVLPMLRHILDQPPLGPNETGPIGLILAPARELAYQIHVVCKGLAKHLGLKSTAVYGGAGVAEQIGDLKRGTHILCATPGRLIDILTMQSGKLISLQRVSMVCLDESDRAFDMGFEPQISAILSAVRPDRQMAMFSATFPKAVENLAKKALRAPLEIIVGGRSVASDSVDQYAEVVEEEDKFLRLLQILGEHADDEKKVIVFVGRQEQADSLFEQLTRCGYSSLSIHGGMDQEDRDSNMSDFKRIDGPNVLVATSVAGRGLDVPSCGCVVNYSSPNHLEDYVHRVGRTGRANMRGVAYTFVNSTDEAKFAPNVVRALVEAGQSKNVSDELKELSESFKEKVAKGEERWAASGYKGKGYTYDSNEMSDAQKLAQMDKRQTMIEAGLLDPDEEKPKVDDQDDNNIVGRGDTIGVDAGSSSPNKAIGKKDAMGMLSDVSASVLAIPGMREALMKQAGMVPTDSSGPIALGNNHYVEELEINDYPQQARWRVTQKETTSRLQDEFQTAVTLKGQYVPEGKAPAEGERRLYLHLEAQTSQILQNCILEIKRLLNEETLKVGARSSGGGRYSVM